MRSRRVPARRAAAVVAIMVAGALALSGCVSFKTPNYENPYGITSMRPAISVAVERYYEQVITWTNCGPDDYCTKVRVPLDWHHVTQRSIGIALVDHRATGQREGSIVVDPGGPGGSGVQFVEDGVENAVDSRLARNFDVVGIDPRGVGSSHPVKCFSDAAEDHYLYDIDPHPIGSSAWVEKELGKASSLANACAKNTGPLLGQIDTVSAAKDLDVVRYALGAPQLNYLGYSYGTYLGTVYAGLYPSNVGRMVLDGAEYRWVQSSNSARPTATTLRGVDEASDAITADNDGEVGQAQAFEDDLDAYLDKCALGSTEALGSAGSCPLGKSDAAAKTAVKAEFATLTAHPLTGHDGRRIGSATLATAIEDALYSTSDWPRLTNMFSQLKRRDSAEAFALADDYNNREPNDTYDDNDDVANLAIGCLEYGHDVDLGFDAAELKVLKRVAPILGAYSGYDDIPCSGWKYGPSAFPNPIRAAGTGPILVLGTTGDPATPYSDAVSLAKLLDGGHLVTYHGEGHTAYDLGDGCIDRTVDDYFIAGTVPKTDPQCH